MATWRQENTVLTNVGLEMLSKAQAGLGKLEITRVVSRDVDSTSEQNIGLILSNIDPGSIKQIATLHTPKGEGGVIPPSDIETVGNNANASMITARFSNEEIGEGAEFPVKPYHIKQIIVFMQLVDIDPNAPENTDMGEVPYMVAQSDGSEDFDNMPAFTQNPTAINYDLYILHTGVANINLRVKTAGYVDEADFNYEITNIYNTFNSMNNKLVGQHTGSYSDEKGNIIPAMTFDVWTPQYTEDDDPSGGRVWSKSDETFEMTGKKSAERFNQYEDNKNIATGECCHVEGQDNVGIQVSCHIEGVENHSGNDDSFCVHIEGRRNSTKTGWFQHVEGENNQSAGYCTHIEGASNKVLASEGITNLNHVEGRWNTIIDGKIQHIEGEKNTIVQGFHDYVGGNLNTLSNSDQTSVHGIENTVEYSNQSSISGNKNTVNNSNKTLVSGAENTLEYSNSANVSGSMNSLAHTENSSVTGQNNILSESNNTLQSGTNNKATSGVHSSLITGDNNTLENASKLVSLGTNNTVKNSSELLVGGKDNNIANSSRSAIFGFDNATKVNENGNSEIRNSYMSGVGNRIQRLDSSLVVGRSNDIADYAFENPTNKVMSSDNVISGDSNRLTGLWSSVVTGSNNVATNMQYSIIGGKNNHLSGSAALGEASGVLCSGNDNVVKSSSDCSVVFGSNNIVSSSNQVVLGRFNEEDTENKFAIIVGGGSQNGNNVVRKNIFELTWDGKLHVPSIYVNEIYSVDGSNKLNNWNIADGTEVGSLVANNVTGNIATGMYSIAMGNTTTASERYAIAGGNKSKSQGQASVALGGSCESLADYAFTTGYLNIAKSIAASAFGYNNNIDSNSHSAFVCGYGNTVKNALAGFITGQNNTLNGNKSSVFGESNTLVGEYSTVHGKGNAIGADNAFVVGSDNEVNASNSVVLGQNNILSEYTGNDKTSAIIGHDISVPTTTETTAIGVITVRPTLKSSLLSGEFHFVYNSTDSIIGGNFNSIQGSDCSLIIGNRNVVDAARKYSDNSIKVMTTNSIVSGEENQTHTKNSIVTGYDNRVCGSSNLVCGDSNHVGHTSNLYVDQFGMRSIVGGEGNLSVGTNNLLIGQGLTDTNAESMSTVSTSSVIYNNIAVLGEYNKINSEIHSKFIIGGGTSKSDRQNLFMVSENGNVYQLGATSTIGADIAEMFEWEDENTSNEDRRGLFVTLNGDKIALADENTKYIHGIVSSKPAVVGNSYADSWHGRYLTDVFGEIIYEDYVIPEQVESYTDENGEKKFITIPEKHGKRPIQNPDYDPEQKYISRDSRPEWSAVSCVGRLVTVDDGTCVPNGYCKPKSGGIATASDSNTGFRVMKRIDDNHVLVWCVGAVTL